MADWWNDLSVLNQTFYGLAIFFSTLFLWQFVSSFAGLAGGESADTGGDTGDVDMGGGDMSFDAEDMPVDVYDGAGGNDVGTFDGSLTEDAAGLATFRLLSVRSTLAFGTLASWAGALYLGRSATIFWALFRAALWGGAGMLVVAFFFWMLPRLAEEGTTRLESAIGQTGNVYLNIPEDGPGQVRVRVGNALQYVRARSRFGSAIPAGRVVRVVRLLDSMTLEVEELEA